MIRSVIRADRIFVKRIVDVLGLRTYNDRRLATSGVEMAGAIFDKSLAGRKQYMVLHQLREVCVYIHQTTVMRTVI